MLSYYWKCFGCNEYIFSRSRMFWSCRKCKLMLSLNLNKQYSLSDKDWNIVAEGSLEMCERTYKLLAYL